MISSYTISFCLQAQCLLRMRFSGSTSGWRCRCAFKIILINPSVWSVHLRCDQKIIFLISELTKSSHLEQAKCRLCCCLLLTCVSYLYDIQTGFVCLFQKVLKIIILYVRSSLVKYRKHKLKIRLATLHVMKYVATHWKEAQEDGCRSHLLYAREAPLLL